MGVQGVLRILALIILVPFLELFIIIKIGERIGFWPTLALIVVPGILGAAMARSQGTAVFSEVKRELARGRLPGVRILDGILIFCGGLLLITPGLLTGLLGLTALFPQARKFYRDLIIYRLLRRLTAGGLRFYIKSD